MATNSPTYWNDSQWAHTHSQAIAERYPNQWVAVYNKQVVAAGNVIREIVEVAKRNVGDHEFVVFFSEQGIRIYRAIVCV